MTTDHTLCLGCGLPAGFNCAVVDTTTGRELGGLCRDCEEETFGRVLTAITSTNDECLVCSRDGFVALPRWESAPREETDVVIAGVAYEIGERTPRLCDEHFHTLVGVEHRQPQREIS